MFLGTLLLALAGCYITEKSDAPEKPQPLEVAVGTPADFSASETPMLPAGRKPSPTASQESGPSTGDAGLAFEMGQALAERTIQAAWKSVSPNGDCSAVPHLAAVVARTSGRVMANATSVQPAEKLEYAQGYISGMRAELNRIAQSCAAQCSALCEAANGSVKTILCTTAKETGTDASIEHPEKMASFQCEGGGCALSPEKVSAADCP